ncbi:MAG: hypothetical protein RBU30_20070 [Polyangia bacterium]|nr:hypothetical protein [Polyangia bacterium]
MTADATATSTLPCRPKAGLPMLSIGALLALIASSIFGAGCSDDDDDQNNNNAIFCAPPTPPAEALRKMGPYDGPGATPGARVLAGNRLLTPEGDEVEVGGFPVDVRTHPTLPLAYVSNTGYRRRAVQVLDLDSGEVVQEIARTEAFYGMALAMTGDSSRLYMGGGDSGRVDAYDIGADGLLTVAGYFSIDGFPAGMAATEDGSTLYVAQFSGRTLAEVDTATGEVLDTLNLGAGVYSVALLPERGASGEVWLTAFQSDKVVIVDLATWTVAASITLGGNPLAIHRSPDGGHVWVTVPDADSVVRIDTQSRQVVASEKVGEASIADGENNPLPASSPTGLWVDFATNRLFVTRAADNAVGLFEADTLAPLGAIPVSWYPTAVALAADGETLVVTNGKGLGTGPLLSYGFGAESGKESMTGTVSLVDLGNLDLAAATAQVEENVRRPDEVWSWSCDQTFPVPSHVGGRTPIEHIVLIVRENKTYDTLFGDLEQGDGDPSLVLYGDHVTPNIHALARQFAHHDNFYDDSECSVQGHLWLTASFANDYMERIWLEDYRGNGFGTDAFMEQGQPDFGTFFTHLIRHGVDFTNYGEIVGAAGACCGETVMDHTDLEFPGGFYNTDVLDEEKAQYVASQIRDQGILAPFTFLLLPNDHTNGTSPGALTPESMIADNDYATGLVVEAISHSEFWPRTAIFIVEDDPQIGADHVEYHRSICVVVSPWSKRGYVSSVHTSIPSLFRTFELILGIGPLNRYDALATPMWDVFTGTPDFTPYTALPRNFPDSYNSEEAPGAAYSRRMDFSGPDRNPELGDLLWWASRGAPPEGSRMARELRGELPSRLDEDPLEAGQAPSHDEAFDSDEEPGANGRRGRDRYDAAWTSFYRYLRDNPEVEADLRPRRRPPLRPLSQEW